MFSLHSNHLERLCKLNSFPVPSDELVVFGIRGCLPAIDDAHDFAVSHPVEMTPINYRNPRCTLILWRPGEGTFAVFPGSTIPSINNIRRARLRDGRGANRLMPCRLDGYFKGRHKHNGPTGHNALRNHDKLPVRRTTNDLLYNNLDEVETDATTPQFDNIHAGWCGGLNKPYDSAGCQVLMGYPKCPRRDNRDNTGPWKAFVEAAYHSSQTNFTYTLLNSRDYRKVAVSQGHPLFARLRFGSEGELVEKVQRALQNHGHYQNHGVDGKFKMGTLEAVLDFQEQKLGPAADDGVIGPQTAQMLGVDWPTI